MWIPKKQISFRFEEARVAENVKEEVRTVYFVSGRPRRWENDHPSLISAGDGVKSSFIVDFFSFDRRSPVEKRVVKRQNYWKKQRIKKAARSVKTLLLKKVGATGIEPALQKGTRS